MKFGIRTTFLLIITSICISLSGQPGSRKVFETLTRYSFYSDEKHASVIVQIPDAFRYSNLHITLFSAGIPLAEWKGIPGKQIIELGFYLSDSVIPADIITEIIDPKGLKYESGCQLKKIRHKPNEVKIDRLTGGIIVNHRQFFPFGFYCYSPVYPTMPEEEVVRGFNMISPYQKILPATLDQRKAYMDRCASLGMKVHYNLLSVSGGGGVSMKDDTLTPIQKRKLLEQEIQTFMDHPALLTWYIADEPTGNNVSPDEIEEIYRLVKSIDPWHPVSVVFMAPFLSAAKYDGGTDIVMADPYPVPDRPLSMVGDVTGSLKREFSGEKPVWIVPQAFGGGELWEREPSPQEIRSMTWQAVIRGATGIQYFIRSGLSSFPKSTAAWNECGRIALEVNSLVPWLLSDEPVINVNTGSRNIMTASRVHNGVLVVMAVNTRNEPSMVRLNIERNITGKAFAIFENREVRITNGSINDIISPFGTLVYRIDLEKKQDSVSAWKDNMIKDPGFENIISPSIPSSCYVSTGGDRGATFFLDPREHAEGDFSLRLETPQEGKSISVKLFPVMVNTGSSYLVSVWAKCDPEQRFTKSSPGKKQVAEISLGTIDTMRFAPETDWKQFIGIINVPADSVSRNRTNLILRMPGQGVGWFDMIQMIEDPLAKDKR